MTSDMQGHTFLDCQTSKNVPLDRPWYSSVVSTHFKGSTYLAFLKLDKPPYPITGADTPQYLQIVQDAGDGFVATKIEEVKRYTLSVAAATLDEGDADWAFPGGVCQVVGERQWRHRNCGNQTKAAGEVDARPCGGRGTACGQHLDCGRADNRAFSRQGHWPTTPPRPGLGTM